MVAEKVSAIVVSDGGQLIGIVTERDLTRAVAGRVHSSEARVREWMTADPEVVSESTDPVEAVQIMLDGGFRHLPVVENERAVGIVSIRDLAEWSIGAEQAQHTLLVRGGDLLRLVVALVRRGRARRLVAPALDDEPGPRSPVSRLANSTPLAEPSRSHSSGRSRSGNPHRRLSARHVDGLPGLRAQRARRNGLPRDRGRVRKRDAVFPEPLVDQPNAISGPRPVRL